MATGRCPLENKLVPFVANSGKQSHFFTFPGMANRSFFEKPVSQLLGASPICRKQTIRSNCEVVVFSGVVLPFPSHSIFHSSHSRRMRRGNCSQRFSVVASCLEDCHWKIANLIQRYGYVSKLQAQENRRTGHFKH